MPHEKQWLPPEKIDTPASFVREIGGHPLVAQTLYRRGIKTAQAARAFMDWQQYTPTPPDELPDMDKAVERLQTAISTGERICVWGDFDVDGQTATALLMSALRDMGANVVSYIPKRLTEGHGVHIPSLKRQIDGGARLILTCDTGIDAHEAVDYANSCGVDTIITDHHKLPDVLPNAAAAVNSRRTPKNHPLRDLPGVGVAYKLVQALAPGRDWAHLLDLVALGVVADVAMQRNDTRYLLQRGLGVLQNTERLGLQAMMELAEVNPVDLNEDDIGFRLAPRLNAIGRLDDANTTTELLTTRNLERARVLANQLEGLNAERQRLSEAVWQGVQAELQREPGLLRHAALVVGHPQWHTGVVGIVANRCVEAYGRPALLLQAAPDGVAKGSARSIPGVDITDAIAENADMLRGYGGHTMAAGLALDTARVDEFRRALSASVRKQTATLDLTPTLPIDGYVALADLNMALVEDVGRLAPFGAGNPPLTLATRNLTITGQRQLGRDAKHLRLTVEDDTGIQQQVIWWNADEPPTGRFDLAYTVRENTFRGEREVLIEWLDYQQQMGDVITVGDPRRNITFIDHRHTPDPRAAYQRIAADEGDNLIVWGEAVNDDAIPAVRRDKLTPTPALLIWTTPPDAGTWAHTLDTVQPERVYLVSTDPNMDTPEPFLKRLAALANYAISKKNGTATLTELAAATAQRPDAVRAGLDWLAAKGHIAVTVDGETLTLAPGGTPTTADEAQARLKRLLDESAAYRKHWRRKDTDALRG